MNWRHPIHGHKPEWTNWRDEPSDYVNLHYQVRYCKVCNKAERRSA